MERKIDLPLILVIILLALLAVVISVFLLSGDPLRTLHYFFLGPLKGRYYIGNFLNSMGVLIFGALGFSIAMQGGSFNLGGEGQIYGGAFVATIATFGLARLGVVAPPLALLAGALFSGLIAALSGFLKLRWGTNELITTFLISYALILVVNYLVGGPFLDPTTNLIATRKIAPQFQLAKILEPSNLSTGLIYALLAVVVVSFYLNRSRSGFELKMMGYNPQFALYSGIRVGWYTLWPMFLSGAFYGLAGGISIFGTYHATVKEFSSGMGWNALAVALIARYRPWAIVPAALFFAYLEAGSRNAMLHSDVTFEIISIVQAVIFFFITSALLKKRGGRHG
ncbi:MAG TPA: ABC transporter permease [Spirochaetales bacterium]|nr:ABC transporter permease [Spirochaetales bacterium]